MLKEQTSAGLVCVCACAEGSANTELVAVITLNALGSSHPGELCKDSKDMSKPNHISSDVNWKLHQSVLGNPIQEGLAPGWCMQT